MLWPAKTLVVLEDQTNILGTHILNGTGHVVNRKIEGTYTKRVLRGFPFLRARRDLILRLNR